MIGYTLKIFCLICFAAFLLLRSAPVFAETGNQSDVTGPIVTTTDQSARGGPKGREFSPRDIVRYRWVRRIQTFKIKLNQLVLAEVSGFPPEVQARLVELVLPGPHQEASLQLVIDSLLSLADERSESQAVELAESLSAVVRGEEVSISAFRQAIDSYNRFVTVVPLFSLQNPTYELAVIRWILDPGQTTLGKLQS